MRYLRPQISQPVVAHNEYQVITFNVDETFAKTFKLAFDFYSKTTNLSNSKPCI